MSDTSGNDAESSRGEEQEEEIDDGPLLSFEFEGNLSIFFTVYCGGRLSISNWSGVFIKRREV